MFDWELVVERLDRIREMIEKIQARSAFVKTSDDFLLSPNPNGAFINTV